ncbi:MAG: serine/threonine protein phosphatase [Chitinophagaceae bacterium]|nr:serine/threonine protein phosphatase [Chitinophagaceae bacterium]
MEALELERLQTLMRYDVLDTPADGSFDRVTKMAAKIFNVPIALITLVDEDRIWFKSKYGLDVEQIGKDPGLCSSAILSDEVYLIEDARNDPRCLTNPLVRGEFGLQFYAAAPLVTTDGYRLGNLCIIDKEKRTLTTEQQEILQMMAGIVMDELELRLQARKRFSEMGKNN